MRDGFRFVAVFAESILMLSNLMYRADPGFGKGVFVHWLIQELSLGGAPWRARGREPITGVWGQSPQRSPGAEALVGGQGGEAPLQLKAF